MRMCVMWWSLVQTPVRMWLMESPTLHTLLTTLLMDISLQTSELVFLEKAVYKTYYYHMYVYHFLDNHVYIAGVILARACEVVCTAQ